jgi:hypothetical protein
MKEFSYQGELRITQDPQNYRCTIQIPADAEGLVVFVAGSGSSSMNPMHQAIAEQLVAMHLGAALFDLLSGNENEIYEIRNDTDLLAERLISITQWLRMNKPTQSIPISYFATGQGTSVALKASAKMVQPVTSLICRGGNPEAALDVAEKINIPVLLIANEKNYAERESHQEIFRKLSGEREMLLMNENKINENESENIAGIAARWIFKYSKTHEAVYES